MLGKRLCTSSGCDRAGEYLRQRLSLEILRGNVGSILGSVGVGDSTSAIFDGGLLDLTTGSHP